MVKNDMSYLQAEMICNAYKANCLRDLETEWVLCGQVVSVNIMIGNHVLADFPVADLVSLDEFRVIVRELKGKYLQRFEYYRAEIKKLQAEIIIDRTGNETDGV